MPKSHLYYMFSLLRAKEENPEVIIEEVSIRVSYASTRTAFQKKARFQCSGTTVSSGNYGLLVALVRYVSCSENAINARLYAIGFDIAAIRQLQLALEQFRIRTVSDCDEDTIGRQLIQLPGLEVSHLDCRHLTKLRIEDFLNHRIVQEAYLRIAIRLLRHSVLSVRSKLARVFSNRGA